MFQLPCRQDKQTTPQLPPCATHQDSPVSETAALRVADLSSSGTSGSPSAPQCRACTASCAWAQGRGHRVSCRSRGGSPSTRARRRAKGAPYSCGREWTLRAIWAAWRVCCVQGGRVEGEGVVWAEGGGGAAARSVRVSRRVVNSCRTASMRNGSSRNGDAISNINGSGRVGVGVARFKGDCSAIVPESRGWNGQEGACAWARNRKRRRKVR